MKAALRAVVGLAIAVAAFYTGWVALHEHPIDLHLVYFAGAGVLLAGVIIDADPILSALKQLLALLPQVRIGNGPPAP